MSSFNGPLRTIVHAPHTTLASVSPVGAATNLFNCFNRALFNTQVTIITVEVGKESF